MRSAKTFDSVPSIPAVLGHVRPNAICFTLRLQKPKGWRVKERQRGAKKGKVAKRIGGAEILSLSKSVGQARDERLSAMQPEGCNAHAPPTPYPCVTLLAQRNEFSFFVHDSDYCLLMRLIPSTSAHKCITNVSAVSCRPFLRPHQLRLSPTLVWYSMPSEVSS